MLATPHLLVGAALVAKTKRPWLGMLAAFASHFVLDAIPHLDSHSLFGSPSGGPTRAEAISTLLDVVVGASLVLWLTACLPRRRLLLAGAFLAAVVDLVYNIPPWNAWLWAYPLTRPLGELHYAIQHRVSPSNLPLGFVFQFAISALAFGMLKTAKVLPPSNRG